jgi:hypothetical protein
MPIGLSARLVSPFESQSEYDTNGGVSRGGSPILVNHMSASANRPYANNRMPSQGNIELYSSVSEAPQSPQSPQSTLPRHDAYSPPLTYRRFDPSHANLSPEYSYFDDSLQPSHAPAPSMSAAFTSKVDHTPAPENPMPFSGYETLQEPTYLTYADGKSEEPKSSHWGTHVNLREAGQRFGQSCKSLATGVKTGTQAWNARRTRPQDTGQSLVTNALQGVLRDKFGANPRKWGKWGMKRS